MTRNSKVLGCLLIVALGLMLIVGDRPSRAQQQSAIQRKTLLQQDATITGYQATINIVEIPVGVSEIRHTHPGPLAVYVLEGRLSWNSQQLPIKRLTRFLSRRASFTEESIRVRFRSNSSPP